MGENLHYENFSRNRNAHGNGLEFTSLNMGTIFIFFDVENFVARAIFLNFLMTKLFFFGDCFWCDIAPPEK
jgi:hypothetical protein